jgi:hypothetical protein
VNKKPLVVRARLKPLAEIPATFLCCERMMQRFIVTRGDVVEALPEKLFEGEIECPWCHKIHKHVKHVRILRAKGNPGSCINIDCYDFDEGAQP